MTLCNAAGSRNFYGFLGVYDMANVVPKSWAKNSTWRITFLFSVGFSIFWFFTFLLYHQSKFQFSLAGCGRGQPLKYSFGGSSRLLFKTAPIVDLLRQSTFLKKVVFFIVYRVSQINSPSHVGVIELVETNKKAHVYIKPLVKNECHWLLKYPNLRKLVNFRKIYTPVWDY